MGVELKVNVPEEPDCWPVTVTVKGWPTKSVESEIVMGEGWYWADAGAAPRANRSPMLATTKRIRRIMYVPFVATVQPSE
jgi:hypothetical protein